jgi:hypothetical protein
MPVPSQARWKHSGVVDYQQIAWFKQVRQVGEAPVQPNTRRSVEVHQPRLIADRGGRLSDELGGELKIEI